MAAGPFTSDDTLKVWPSRRNDKVTSVATQCLKHLTGIFLASRLTSNDDCSHLNIFFLNACFRILIQNKVFDLIHLDQKLIRNWCEDNFTFIKNFFICNIDTRNSKHRSNILDGKL